MLIVCVHIPRHSENIHVCVTQNRPFRQSLSLQRTTRSGTFVASYKIQCQLILEFERRYVWHRHTHKINTHNREECVSHMETWSRMFYTNAKMKSVMIDSMSPILQLLSDLSVLCQQTTPRSKTGVEQNSIFWTLQHVDCGKFNIFTLSHSFTDDTIIAMENCIICDLNSVVLSSTVTNAYKICNLHDKRGILNNLFLGQFMCISKMFLWIFFSHFTILQRPTASCSTPLSSHNIICWKTLECISKMRNWME